MFLFIVIPPFWMLFYSINFFIYECGLRWIQTHEFTVLFKNFYLSLPASSFILYGKPIYCFGSIILDVLNCIHSNWLNVHLNKRFLKKSVKNILSNYWQYNHAFFFFLTILKKILIPYYIIRFHINNFQYGRKQF